jgi:hypothetical protein
MDKGEIEVIFSQETKEQNDTKMTEEMVDGMLGIFLSSCNIDKGECFMEQIQTCMLQNLKKLRSVKKKESSDTAQISDKIITKFEDCIEAVKGNDNGTTFKAFDDVFLSFSDVFTSSTENNTESENARKKKMSHVLNSLRSGFADIQKDDGPSEFLPCFNEMTTFMQDELKDKADKRDDENMRENKFASTIIGGFSQFMKVVQKSDEPGNQNGNLVDDLRKTVDEISQELRNTSVPKQSSERKYDTDIDLD